MAPPAMDQIGSVVTLNGSAWAMTSTGDRPLDAGDPVYRGESVVTGANANLEIRFLDGTLLGQGGESRVDLDEYVFDDSDAALNFQMVTGVIRMVSGKIAETNPEAFNLSTPLATIGIRGTEIIAKINVNNQIIGVTDMAPGHYVVVATPDGEVRINAPGLFSGVDESGFLIQSQPLSQQFIDAVAAVVPLTAMGEAPRDPGTPDPELPDPVGGTAGQGGPDGTPEEPEEEASGEQADEDGPTSPIPSNPSPLDSPSVAPPPPPPPSPAPSTVTTSPSTTQSSGDDDVVIVTDDDDVPDDDTDTRITGENWTDVAGNDANHVGTAYDDTMSGLDGEDTLKGEAGNDSISGGSANDVLYGGTGSDTLDGELGDDTMYGNDGNDSMVGNNGADFLIGNGGSDTLTGGAGADTFYYAASSDGADSITDFDSSTDTVGLGSSGDFSAIAFDSGGTLRADNFAVYNNATYEGSGVSFGSGVTSGVVYASEAGSSSGKLYFDPDVNVTGDEVLLADITEEELGANVDNNLDQLAIESMSEPGLN